MFCFAFLQLQKDIYFTSSCIYRSEKLEGRVLDECLSGTSIQFSKLLTFSESRSNLSESNTFLFIFSQVNRLFISPCRGELWILRCWLISAHSPTLWDSFHMLVVLVQGTSAHVKLPTCVRTCRSRGSKYSQQAPVLKLKINFFC